MPFTAINILLALLVLIVVFGVIYQKKGLKVALISTGIAFALLTLLFVATINTIISAM